MTEKQKRSEEDIAAAPTSSILVRDGYVDWLSEKMKREAFAMFSAADEADKESLQAARVFLRLIAIVETTITENARLSTRMTHR